jgi:hypothetical protein
MIQNMFKRRKESDTYLATVSRPRWSLQIAMSLPFQLMMAAVLAESYTFYPLSSRSADSSEVY